MSEIDASYALDIADRMEALWERVREYITRLEDMLTTATERAAEFEERAYAAERKMMAMATERVARTGNATEMIDPDPDMTVLGWAWPWYDDYDWSLTPDEEE